MNNINSHSIGNSNATSTSKLTNNSESSGMRSLDKMIRSQIDQQLVSNTNIENQIEDLSLYNQRSKKVRTSDDFLQFINIVLTYANYPEAFSSEEESREDRKNVESPLNSIGESAQGSAISTTSSSSDNPLVDIDMDDEFKKNDESWGMVTCWCGKPFAGRPMIECESCLVWLHLSCARVRKSNIPKHFKCTRCKPRLDRRKRSISGNSEGDINSSAHNHMTPNNELLINTTTDEGNKSLNGSSSSPANCPQLSPSSYKKKKVNKKTKKKSTKGNESGLKKKTSSTKPRSKPMGKKLLNNHIAENPNLPLRLTFTTLNSNPLEFTS